MCEAPIGVVVLPRNSGCAGWDVEDDNLAERLHAALYGGRRRTVCPRAVSEKLDPLRSAPSVATLLHTRCVRLAAPTLLEAVERYPEGRREDRLTEVFACALAGLEELACWFVEQAGNHADIPGPGPVPKFSVESQVTGSGEGRPDMRIRYTDVNDQQRVVLSEHKIDADLTNYQRLGYQGWQRDTLVLVAPLTGIESYRVIENCSFDTFISWLDIAVELDRIGALAGPQWRKTALEPDQPSRQRVLAETLAFIERQHVGVSLLPIDEQLISTYSRWRETHTAMHAFLEQVRQDPRIQALEPGTIKHDLGDQWWFPLNVPWPYLVDRYDQQCGAVIALQPNSDWLDPPSADPMLYAGYWFVGEPLNPTASAEHEIATALRATDAHVGLNPRNRKQGNCAATLLLTELLAEETTLTEQAHTAATWAAERIAAISRIGAITQ
jgi:hypothetical protein